MRRISFRRHQIVDLLLLYLVSLGVAFLIAYVAYNQENPLVVMDFPERIPVQVTGPEEYLQALQNLSDRSIRIRIRAPQKTWQELTVNDFAATLDLMGLGPGIHEVPFNVDVANSLVEITELQPSTLRVQLDTVVGIKVPVEVEIAGAPAPGYRVLAPSIDPLTVTVSGPSALVTTVARVRAELVLSESANVQLLRNLVAVPVNRQNQPVSQVIVVPETISVTVPITRTDVSD